MSHHHKQKNRADFNRQFVVTQIDTLLLYGTFGLLMFGPLAFGAVERWSIFVVETGTVLLILLWLAKQWLNEEVVIIWNPLFLPMGVFAP